MSNIPKPSRLTFNRTCAGALAATLMSSLAAPVVALADEMLEEIVVTAQRQSERLQDVPIAVTAILADDLVARGVRQAGDVAALVPNLMLNSPYGPEVQRTFTLRGVKTQDFSENQSSPVAMYVDEVYKPGGLNPLTDEKDPNAVESPTPRWNASDRSKPGSDTRNRSDYQGVPSSTRPSFDSIQRARGAQVHSDLQWSAGTMHSIHKSVGFPSSAASWTWRAGQVVTATWRRR